jgi:hypothetical protein
MILACGEIKKIPAESSKNQTMITDMLRAKVVLKTDLKMV